MFIKRCLFEKLLPWLDSPHILIIKGARRAGKTTLLKFIKEYLEKRGQKVALLSVDQLLFEPYFKDPLLFEKISAPGGAFGRGASFSPA